MKTKVMFLALCLSMPAFAQTVPPAAPAPPPTATATGESGDTPSPGDLPFKITLGPQVDGGFSATVKGDGKQPIDLATNAAVGLFRYGVDGNWSSTAKSQFTATMQMGVVFTGRRGDPTFDPDSSTIVWGADGAGIDPPLQLYLDLTQKGGNFKTVDGTDGNVGQTLIGVSAIWIPKLLSGLAPLPKTSAPIDTCWALGNCKVEGIATDLPPYITFSYHHAIDTQANQAALPDGIEEDMLVGSLKGDLTAFRKLPMPLRFVFEVSGTYPVTGDDKSLESHVDIGLGLRVNDKFTPLVQYVSGEKQGFKFDRQLIVGFLWDLTGLGGQ